jgi:pSer/pThr/pTyr-binding forkhead associated (FHA) protein
MVPAGSGASNSVATASINSSTPVNQPVPSTAAAQAFAPSPGIASGEKIKLTSQIHGITIEAVNGDIIGRKNGAFAGIFGSFNYVSGTHCKLVKTAAGWYIQDMGSTNGTFYNGSKLEPNVLYPLASGTTITIADLELLVTYDTTGDGTTRL